MIAIPGRLTVREITGRKGKFVVGDLTTEIGNFKVKDTLLDQFEPGVYSGTFMVLNIYPDSYIWQGRVTTEIRAKIHEIHLDHEDKDPPASEQAAPEPDPAEQAQGGNDSTPPAPPPTAQPKASAPLATTPAPLPEELAPGGAEAGNTDPDMKLFGPELYQAVQTGSQVKLDPTIDRTQFRAQRDRLKALGFQFEAASQSWTKQS